MKTKRSNKFEIGQFPGLGKFTTLFYCYLYLPIIVVVVLSFNSSSSATVWEGFSTKWYGEALANQGIRSAAWNSIQIALVSATVAMILSILAALVIARYPSRKESTISQSLIMLPLVLPEIIVAIAILGFFSSLGLAAGKLNLILAHTVVCIPFAFLPVRARLQDMDISLQQAAADLYAGPIATFFKVTLPLLIPGVISGFMLAFVVSMDNFTISVLVAQAGSTTLPVYIFGMLRQGVTPDVNAISTIFLLLSILMVVASYLITSKNK